MRKNYNKLIRDNIPEIMTKKGVSFVSNQVTNDTYLRLLMEKVIEEGTELFNATTQSNVLEEFFDLILVIKTLERELRKTMTHQEFVKGESNARKKTKNKGVFDGKIMLKYTE